MHTVRSENRPELSLEPHFPPPRPDPERTRKRLLLALGVLLVALVAVILKNWDFWFPPSAESEYASVSSGNKSGKGSDTNKASSRQRSASAAARSRKAAEAVAEPGAMEATTERTALPDLQVEVIAGNQRKTLTARSNAINLDLASPTPSVAAPQVTPQQMVANSDPNLHMSPQAAQTVSHPVAPDYPLLARQMKVQGAVILQALISRDGNIQELQIVSGPAILADAAREAVKQWHFRPFYQNGHPIQTQARVTVNFTISTN